MEDTGKTIALIKALSGSGGSGGLPPVTASDAGKVLAVDNSGVWGASYLYGYGRRIQVEATYSNGEYSTDTQITPSELMNAITAGYDFQLFVGAAISRMHLIATKGDTYLVFRATLMNGATVEVLFNGFDQEYLTISIYPYDNRFIVTLTPTSPDYSGTMDKTVAEINAAYEAGREIVFSLSVGTDTFEIPMAYRCADATGAYFMCYIIDTINNMMIIASTLYAQTSTTYSTKIYPLTPAT